MLMPECYGIYYRDQVQRIRRDYGRAVEMMEVEGVHDLRVDIKRFRAYGNLIEYVNPVFSAAVYLKTVRRLFKSAGPLRDLQVQLELVRDRSRKSDLELSEYYNALKSRETQARKVFLRKAGRFDFEVFDSMWTRVRRCLMYISPEYIRYKAEARFKGLVDEVIAFRGRTDFQEDDYHAIRILAKEARYALEIIRQCYPARPEWEGLNNRLRSLHQALGRWHDSDVGLQHVESFLLDYAGRPFYSPSDYTRLAHGLQEEKELFLGKFEKDWKIFLAGLDRDNRDGEGGADGEEPVQNCEEQEDPEGI